MAPLEEECCENFDFADSLELEARQGGVCPGLAPVECDNGECCAPGSVCQAISDDSTGCVISNNQGQTLTLTAMPRTTEPGRSTTSSDSDASTTSSKETVTVVASPSTTPLPPVVTTFTVTPTSPQSSLASSSSDSKLGPQKPQWVVKSQTLTGMATMKESQICRRR